MSADTNAGAVKAEGKKNERKKEKPRSSYELNDKYVKRAFHLFDMMRSLAEIYDDSEELAAMNRNKRGAPYKYTHSLIAVISRVRDVLQLDFRGCEGMAKAFMTRGYPDFTTIFRRRVNAQRMFVGESLSDVVSCEDMSIGIIPDGAGITPATRSEYVRVVHSLKRGFLRLSIIINKETLEIVAFKLTDSSVGEPAVFDELLENALVNMGIEPDERRRQVRQQKDKRTKTYVRIVMTADGGYDTRRIFSFCKKLDIIPNIRVQTNSNARADGVDRSRSEVVLEQLGGSAETTPAELAVLADAEREENRKAWKKDVDYGMRWLVEIVISAFKRLYGDSVMARKMENIRQEILLKIRSYNAMLQIGREVSVKA